MSFPTCTVKIPLWPLELETVSRSGIFQSIDEIAYAVSQLRDNGISVCISLQAADGINLPAPDVMRSVASVVHEVDYAQIAAMTSTSWQPQGWERFSEDHLRALKSARKRLQVLCISDALAAHYFERESISLVASFTQLKKLVLQTKVKSPDLSSLTQLKLLEDQSHDIRARRLCKADPQPESQAYAHPAVSHMLGRGNLSRLVKGDRIADTCCQCLLPVSQQRKYHCKPAKTSWPSRCAEKRDRTMAQDLARLIISRLKGD